VFEGEAMRVSPFRPELPGDALADLRERLARTRLPDDGADSDSDLGMRAAKVRALVERWRAFDFAALERAIAAVPHFFAEDGEGRIHFAHLRGRGPNPLPLLLLHGWPGSFLEMLEIAPMLADPAAHGGDAADAFDVVVPSLPGYGFSDAPRARDAHAGAFADRFARLMDALGYARFGAQGGDWGASVATRLAQRHASRLAGIHLNYVPGSYAPYIGDGAPPLSPAERSFLEERAAWVEEEGAYGRIQATRPRTLAVGLSDSPAGLLAWIGEKFLRWCAPSTGRGRVEHAILAHATLYWVTGSIGSAVRLYAEGRRAPVRFEAGERVGVPCGVARFPLEAPMPPREWVGRAYDVVRWTEMARGGHFAALEEPELLARDVREFFRPLRAGA
jgi:pimeloyl-ACP methyl ester carboxylesterase